jgi:tripartite-type tricarboxylate transporter receptor subunit TctC
MPTRLSRSRRAVGLLVTAATMAAHSAVCWAWPDRPVQVIVAFPPGGGADVLARALAEDMGKTLGQSVIVVNREGGSGTIATQAIAKAAADGYTLGFGPVGPLVLQPHLKANLPYKPDELVGVCQTFVNNYALVTGPASRYKTLADVVAEARRKPDEVSYGTGGIGSFPHMAAVQFAAKAGVRMRAIPYRGDPPMMLALKGGEIELGTVAVGLAQTQGLHILGVFAPERLPEAPNAPTMKEQGFAVATQLFGGLIAPKGTPEPVLKALQSSCEQATRSEKYVAASKITQQDVVFKAGAEFTKAIAREHEVQREVVKAGGFKPE